MHEGAQIPLTWDVLLLQGPRLGGLLAQQADPGEGGVRVADVVAGVWSGKAKQEEERQVAKKTQLGDPATMPPFIRAPRCPHSILTFFLLAKAHSLPQKLECEKLWEGNKDPGENE